MSGEMVSDRRQFMLSALAVGGGMMLGISNRAKAAGSPAAAAAEPEINAWITIAPDDGVFLRIGTPEVGNGVLTQCAMTVTEELECAWNKVQVEFASPLRDLEEDRVYSKGGHLGFFAGRSTNPLRQRMLLQAGASARERLKAAAAEVWKVPATEIEARESRLTHLPTKRVLRYGEVAERAATVSLAHEPDLKPEAAWRFLGKASPGKLNNPAIVTGKAVYGMDIRQPNMLYAALLQSPVQGGRLKSYDFAKIKDMPGVHSVVVVDPDEPRAPLAMKPTFDIEMSRPQSAIAVLADHYWQARTALEALPVTWDDGKGADWKTTEQVYEAARKACRAEGKIEKLLGDPKSIWAEGGKLVEATYLTPYCDNAPMEPLNGTALVTADRVDVWHPAQQPQMVLFVAAHETGLPPDRIHVHQTFVGGAFGRRVFGDDARMVVAVARKVPGRPVHVIWSREEMTRQGRYRPMIAAHFTARLDASGMPVALRAHCVGNGHELHGLINSPFASGLIPNVRIETTTLPLHFLTGSYRGPGYNSQAFFLNCFLDECAAAAGTNPLDYRLKLLAAWEDEGWIRCINEVKQASGWGQKLPRGQGRGIAVANWGLHDGRPHQGTTVAAVAHVEVSKAGDLKVLSLDVAFDTGRLLNRDAVAAQVEGGTLFGLNMSLNEELTIENGRMVEGNFDAYPMIRLADIPPVRIHFGAISGHDRYSEVGEPPVGPIGPAIVNAIYAATGKRIRQTPTRKQDLSWT